MCNKFEKASTQQLMTDTVFACIKREYKKKKFQNSNILELADSAHKLILGLLVLKITTDKSLLKQSSFE